MKGFFDLFYAAKAWAAGVVVAVGNVVTLVQVAAADKAISLDEANGIWIAVTEAVTVVLATGLSAVRCALHAAGGSTPGWEDHFAAIQSLVRKQEPVAA